MRNNPTGGMRTSGTSYAICCPLCHKPAATATMTDGKEIYMHFTKVGSVYHVREDGKWNRKRKIS